MRAVGFLLTAFFAAWCGASDVVVSPCNVHWWPEFSTQFPGTNGVVNAFAITADGQTVYVGGSFSSVSGQPASRVAAWTNGEWLPLGAGLNGRNRR